MKYKKIILSLLLIIWMTTIFMFSNQVSDKSSNTSGNTIRFILNKLQITKNMTKQQENELVENLQTPIRKLAHFSVYALGGIISYMLFSQYKISNKKRIIFSLLFCMIYAITDEIHQHFVPGRSCELRDVLIDTTGAMLGIFISYVFSRISHKKKEFKA